MKRALLVPAFAILFLAGCAVHAGYYAAGPPPPAPVVGVVGYAPGPGYVWIDGFYDWRGRYVWVPGYWARRLRIPMPGGCKAELTTIAAIIPTGEAIGVNRRRGFAVVYTRPT